MVLIAGISVLSKGKVRDYDVGQPENLETLDQLGYSIYRSSMKYDNSGTIQFIIIIHMFM